MLVCCLQELFTDTPMSCFVTQGSSSNLQANIGGAYWNGSAAQKLVPWLQAAVLCFSI